MNTQTTPYVCPRCKTAVGYLAAGQLHVEINGRTFKLDGFITLTCPHPCNHTWKYRRTTQSPKTTAAALPLAQMQTGLT